MEIKNNGSKLVKPSMPTPQTLRKFDISFFDEQQLTDKTPLILYYPVSKELQNDHNHGNIFNHLETSLSKTLTDFYPLVGRYMRQGSFVDCGDQGALYVHAKANFQLLEFLCLEWDMKLNMLQRFIPLEDDEEDGMLLSVKVTSFKCGGVAIGMCFSHKISDFASMCTFINSWATRTQDIGNEEKESIHPDFSLNYRFPKRGVLDLSSTILPEPSDEVKNTVRVFSFKGSAISKMRERVTFEDNRSRRPSKVLLVEALLWKAFVGIDEANTWHKKASFVSQAVNLRNKLVPKLPNNAYGNIVTIANARLEPSDQVNNMDLQDFFKLLHDAIMEIDGDYVKAVSLEEKDYEFLVKPYMERNQNAANNDANFYFFTSWCKFSVNNADFGWGRPVWKGTAMPDLLQNVVILMDDQEGDGVEAWVYLDEKRMHQLKKDPNIMAYAI